jgi:hypothetical protein
MIRRLIMYLKRPMIDDQNTGRLAYQPYNHYALAGVNGNGGQGVRRSIRATNPGTLAVGPTHKINDPTVTGNTNAGPQLQSLVEQNAITSASIASL